MRLLFLCAALPAVPYIQAASTSTTNEEQRTTQELLNEEVLKGDITENNQDEISGNNGSELDLAGQMKGDLPYDGVST
jgi:hypothetical protein